MTDPIITFSGVTKSYDGVTDVVKELDFEVARGEFLTLLGPSGSGKTTILMMLAGFEEPSRGEITFGGRRLNNVPAHKRNIGVVFQNYALFPHMSVAGNLSFPLEMQGVGRAEREGRVNAALDMVRLRQLGDRMPSQLSGGQQQRVALARALVFNPDLVLMDEPLGALDKQLREHMQIEIKHIHERLGVTVIYVTHDQTEALTMSDRVAVFHQGRIEQCAPPGEIYEHPSNAFVASFIGENNRLDGTVVKSRGGTCEIRLNEGPVIAASSAADLAADSPVAISLRPERIRLGGEKAKTNAFEAVVEELIYFGDHTKLRLGLDGGATLIARASQGDSFSGAEKGDKLRISWSPEHCRAFPAG
ncbi:MAG: ABC transporter ATP-binding protein [Flavobacteriaceae bacterium]